jgi:hypothetical protein
VNLVALDLTSFIRNFSIILPGLSAFTAHNHTAYWSFPTGWLWSIELCGLMFHQVNAFLFSSDIFPGSFGSLVVQGFQRKLEHNPIFSHWSSTVAAMAGRVHATFIVDTGGTNRGW